MTSEQSPEGWGPGDAEGDDVSKAVTAPPPHATKMHAMNKTLAVFSISVSTNVDGM